VHSSPPSHRRQQQQQQQQGSTAATVQLLQPTKVCRCLCMQCTQHSRNLPQALLTPVKSHADPSYPLQDVAALNSGTQHAKPLSRDAQDTQQQSMAAAQSLHLAQVFMVLWHALHQPT
jgi:hypothetical protein